MVPSSHSDIGGIPLTVSVLSDPAGVFELVQSFGRVLARNAADPEREEKGLQFVDPEEQRGTVRPLWNPVTELSSGRLQGFGVWLDDRLQGAILYTRGQGSYDVRFFHLDDSVATETAARAMAECVLASDVEDVCGAGVCGARLRAPVTLSRAEADDAFVPLGFVGFTRVRMTVELRGIAQRLPRYALPSGYEIVSFVDHPIRDPGLLAHMWYRETIDGFLVVDSTLDGARQTYRRLTGNRLGTFSRRHSAVLLHRDEVAGAAYVLQGPRRIRIADLSLAPEERGRGLAKALLSRVLASAAKGGYTQAELNATKENTPAYRLYSGMGFATRGLSHRYMRRQWPPNVQLPDGVHGTPEPSG